ncbi:MAG: hypothetical protein KF784_04915 [Fimbriimonadaceae bacterium]|nr:hypothetical protein [Fimbriimonadaceae bacterium]
MIQAEHKTFAELVGFSTSRMPANAGETHGTTVLALRHKDGVLMLADRRATAGNLVMFDHAEKIIALDDSTILAISGSFARSVEVSRFLKHSFKYYRRTVLSEMSLDGKLMEISRALAGNLSAAMEGVGVFLPIVAAYDAKTGGFSMHFFDVAGARFQNAQYACAGSGSERIRGVFEFLGRTKKPWETRPLDDVLADGLLMLDIAADLDSATGGFSKILPAAFSLTVDGIRPVDEKQLQKASATVLNRS